MDAARRPGGIIGLDWIEKDLQQHKYLPFLENFK